MNAAPPGEGVIRLADGIDVAGAAAQFRRSGHARIAPFLAQSSCDALRADLLARTDWREVFNVGDKVYEIDLPGQNSLRAEERARIDAGIAAAARAGFQYRYQSVRIPDGSDERARLTGPLADFARLMASETCLSLLRDVTDTPGIDFADAQATWYRPGDFLTRHHDLVEGKNRHAAYVFGLTPRWRPEWGGLLLFHDDDDDVARGLTPRWNCLNLFAVPTPHSVSQVADYVDQPRLSVTGWLRTLTGR